MAQPRTPTYTQQRLFYAEGRLNRLDPAARSRPGTELVQYDQTTGLMTRSNVITQPVTHEGDLTIQGSLDIVKAMTSSISRVGDHVSEKTLRFSFPADATSKCRIYVDSPQFNEWIRGTIEISVSTGFTGVFASGTFSVRYGCNLGPDGQKVPSDQSFEVPSLSGSAAGAYTISPEFYFEEETKRWFVVIASIAGNAANDMNVYVRVLRSSESPRMDAEFITVGAPYTGDASVLPRLQPSIRANLSLTDTKDQVVAFDASGIVIQYPFTPTTSTAPGTKGQITYDTNYVYVCIDTNTWTRIPLATW